MARSRNSLMIYLLIPPILYLVICAALYFQQDSLVFVPTRDAESVLDQVARSNGFEPWKDARGERIGWQSVEGDPKNALLILNGNGGYALHRAYYLNYCRDHGSWKVFLLEYPGYGARGGEPSEKCLTAAALVAVDTLASNPNGKIWLLGESLGSGVACATVGLRPEKIAGLILITPFNSLVAAANAHYPWLPVSLLLKTRFDSEKNLALYPGPVAFVVGEEDTVVPARLGHKLYDNYAGQKRLWSVPNAGHNVTEFLDGNWPQIIDWLQSGKSKA